MIFKYIKEFFKPNKLLAVVPCRYKIDLDVNTNIFYFIYGKSENSRKYKIKFKYSKYLTKNDCLIHPYYIKFLIPLQEGVFTAKKLFCEIDLDDDINLYFERHLFVYNDEKKDYTKKDNVITIDFKKK